MGIFGNSASPLEAEIEKATSETNTSEKWSLIMDVCDKIGSNSINAKESLRIIIKRLNHADPHVVMQAITLLDACINNCGKNYHLEVASREFEQEFKKLVAKSQPTIANKLKQCLKKWAEGDFKSDPQLNLIPSLYNKMKLEGHDFVDHSTPVKREIEKSNDPNVVSSQQEEDDIAKAIELSLKEKFTPSKTASNNTVNSSSLYPSVSAVSNSSNVTSSTSKAAEPRKVRAIYDFEAAEDNELTFKAGEIIMVIEESDPNWWRGTNHRGEGYFPANFVTADLSAEPEDLSQKENRKSHKTSNNANSNDEPKIERAVEINEEAIDRLLFLLHEADPEDPSQDTDEMMRLENFVNQMGPLIDSELERVDRRHAQLTQLSSDLIDTINLYHSLMRDTEKIPMMNTFPAMQNQMYRPNSSYQMPGGMIDPHLMGQMGIREQMHSTFPSHLVQQPSNMPGPMSQINQIPSMAPTQEQMMQYQQPVNGVQPMSQMYPNSQDMSHVNMTSHQQNHPSLPPTFPQNHNLAQNYSLSPLQQHQQQMNGMVPQNYQMNPNMIPLNPALQQQQQITDMLGNMTLQSSMTQQITYPQQQTVDVAPQQLYQQP